MTNREYADIWNEIRDKVCSYNDVEKSQVYAFFGRMYLQVFSRGFIMITVPTSFLKNWVTTYYLPLIDRALQDIYNIHFIISIEVDETESAFNDVDEDPSQAPSGKPVATAPSTKVPDEIEEPASTKEEDTSSEKSSSFEDQPQNTFSSTNIHSGSPYTFENYVIGDSNKLAYSMARSVAEKPGQPHLNPLFIYGKSGVGKTHLLRAIQNSIEENYSEDGMKLTTIYVDANDFINRYADASADHTNEKHSFKHFKEEYENADVLLIDDVQNLQGKKQTLNIIFQIFNLLVSKGKQVVLSADIAPKNIDIEERYKSRFNSGGTFDIATPEVETKLGIIKSYISEIRESGTQEFFIPEDAVRYIAENSNSNIRELKSAVSTVLAWMYTWGKDTITADEVKEVLEDHFSGIIYKQLTVDDIVENVARHYQVKVKDILSNKRNAEISLARQVAIFCCREMLDMSFEAIGKAFKRTHSTVQYSANLIAARFEENKDMRDDLTYLMNEIRE